MGTIVCEHCKRRVISNKKLKHLKQHYCGSAECQHSRRLLFARTKYRTNEEFRAAKLKKVAGRHSHQRDRPVYSDYQRTYRLTHPEYAKRNRLKQRLRYEKKKQERCQEEKIVNPYAIMSQQSDNEHVYALLEIDLKKIVNPYAIMPEHINKLLITDIKPVVVKLL